MGPYRPVFQLLSLRRHIPTGHPSPSREAAARRVEESEVVAVADARHAAEETPAAEEAGLDVCCFRDAAEVGTVEADYEEGGASEEDGGYHGAWVGVVGPVGGVERIGP